MKGICHDGFDEGLRHAYDTTCFNQGREWRVTRIPYNAPGMLVWSGTPSTP